MTDTEIAQLLRELECLVHEDAEALSVNGYTALAKHRYDLAERAHAAAKELVARQTEWEYWEDVAEAEAWWKQQEEETND